MDSVSSAPAQLNKRTPSIIDMNGRKETTTASCTTWLSVFFD
jgi:hypothetical protein